MSEAEYLYDLYIGDMVTEEMEKERISLILTERECRLNALINKYVIVCKGIKTKKKVYLQDRKVSKGGWWTNYLSNAIGYVSLKAAKEKCKSFKHNSPKVMKVVRHGSVITTEDI